MLITFIRPSLVWSDSDVKEWGVDMVRPHRLDGSLVSSKSCQPWPKPAVPKSRGPGRHVGTGRADFAKATGGLRAVGGAQHFDARELLPLEQLEGRAAPRGDVFELAGDIRPRLRHGGRAVAAAD